MPSYAGLRPASDAASRCKRANTKRDTKPELLLRRTLWSLGLRYRTHAADLPGVPDLVFRKARVAVFCDGDFWHGRDWPVLESRLRQRHNADYWVAKIGRNRERDDEHTQSLTRSGWLVVRLWETDIARDPAGTARQVIQAVAVRSRQTGNIASNMPPA